jgi:hypothetical protein
MYASSEDDDEDVWDEDVWEMVRPSMDDRSDSIVEVELELELSRRFGRGQRFGTGRRDGRRRDGRRRDGGRQDANADANANDDDDANEMQRRVYVCMRFRGLSLRIMRDGGDRTI